MDKSEPRKICCGAFVGDINGSVQEFGGDLAYDSPLFQDDMFLTDDSFLTVASMDALLQAGPVEEGPEYEERLASRTKECLIRYTEKYPFAGYGAMFMEWVKSKGEKPYHSDGNGGAMRVSPCGWLGRSLEETLRLARIVTGVTHDGKEGMKAALATASSIYLARMGKDKDAIARNMSSYYPGIEERALLLSLPGSFSDLAEKSVPHAFACFLMGEGYEDTLRLAMARHGDVDTEGAIACSIAEAFYGPENFPLASEKALHYFNEELLDVIHRFQGMVESI